MRGCPVYSNGIDRELVTPTGAAIATTLVQDFGSPPQITIKQVGLGAGSLDLPIPNILRLWFGESESLQIDNSDLAEYSPSLETITVLETQIDDLNPQVFSYIFEALFTAGAVDVITQPIGMKKSRTGILLTVICHPDKLASCEAVLFRETSTLGIRRTTQQRAVLQREMQKVETIYGTISVKVAWTGKATEKVITNVQPEYEDCAELAKQNNIPWREIHRLALESWYLQSHNKLDGRLEIASTQAKSTFVD